MMQILANIKATIISVARDYHVNISHAECEKFTVQDRVNRYSQGPSPKWARPKSYCRDEVSWRAEGLFLRKAASFRQYYWFITFYISMESSQMNRLEVENRLDKLARALQRYQQTNHEQFEQATLQQARLNKMLADLDSRLRSVEIAASKQTTEAVVSDREWSKPQTRLN